MYTRSPVYSGIGVLSCATAWPVEPARSTSSVNSIRTRIWRDGDQLRDFVTGRQFVSYDDIEKRVAPLSGAGGREILHFFDVAPGKGIVLKAGHHRELVCQPSMWCPAGT